MTMVASNPLQSKVQRIENKIDADQMQTMRVSAPMGGMQFQSMIEVMEFAKLMAVSDIAVPKHLRGNPGACLAICIQAVEWRMSPYAVANKSYVVNDRVSYESQLIHAVVEQRAPLQGRLRCRYTGEGDSRRCIVYAKVKGEEEPFEFQSAEFGSILPKNSPLWKTKPDLQLFYNASRDWARMYFPDVILGVYAEDEIDANQVPGLAATSSSPATTSLNALLQQQASALPTAEAQNPTGDVAPGDSQVTSDSDSQDQRDDSADDSQDKPVEISDQTWDATKMGIIAHYERPENGGVATDVVVKALTTYGNNNLPVKGGAKNRADRAKLIAAVKAGKFNVTDGSLVE